LASKGLESTVDVTLASNELADTLIKCTIYAVEYGSDHRAIETTFDTTLPEEAPGGRLLLSNAPWSDIRTRVAATPNTSLYGGVYNTKLTH